MIDANDDVIATRFTFGAFALMAFNIPVVPITAGSSKSFFGSVILKWKGLAVWITASNGGFETTASLNAPSLAMSSTMTYESLLWGTPLWCSKIFWPFSSDLAVVTTSCLEADQQETSDLDELFTNPCSRRSSRMCAAIKPLPPVRRTFIATAIAV